MTIARVNQRTVETTVKRIREENYRGLQRRLVWRSTICRRGMILPFIGLILFLTFVYFEPALVFPVLGEVRAAFLIAVVTMVMAYMAGARPPKALQNRLFIALIFIAIVSVLTAPLPADEITRAHLSHLFKAVALFFLVSMIITSKKYVGMFYHVTIGFGFIVAFITLLTVRAGIEGLKGGNLYRMVNYFGGIGDDPNEFGVLMVAMMPLPLGLIEEEKSLAKKALLLLIALVFVLCAIRTRSRGAFLGLAIVSLLLLWQNRRRAGAYIAAVLMALYVLTHTHYGYWERLSTLESMDAVEQDHSANTRMIQNKYAIELMKRHPLTGVGPGNFIRAKINILGVYPSSRQARYVPHNTYLGLGAEMGLFALAVFLGVIFFSIRDCYIAERNLRRIGGPAARYRNMAGSVRIGLIGLIVTITFLSEQYNLIMYQFIAMAVSFRALSEKELAQPVQRDG